MSGVLATLLGEQGYIGSGTVLDGPFGVIKALSLKDEFDYGRITETLGKKWEMTETMKPAKSAMMEGLIRSLSLKAICQACFRNDQPREKDCIGDLLGD